jgi:hypothetical protein
MFIIWIKSFIPNKHDTNPGFVIPVPHQPGKTMFKGPLVSCYNTNNRVFFDDSSAEAKTRLLYPRKRPFQRPS